MDNDSIRQNISQLRMQKGLSKVEMADRLDIDRCTYGKIESGAAQLINKHIPGIASVLGVSVSALVNGYEPDKDAVKTAGQLKDTIKSLSDRIEELNKTIDDLRMQIAKDNELIAAKSDLLDLYKSIANAPQAMSADGAHGFKRASILSDPQEEY